jgi:hypothetical protein
VKTVEVGEGRQEGMGPPFVVVAEIHQNGLQHFLVLEARHEGVIE